MQFNIGGMKILAAEFSERPLIYRHFIYDAISEIPFYAAKEFNTKFPNAHIMVAYGRKYCAIDNTSSTMAYQHRQYKELFHYIDKHGDLYFDITCQGPIPFKCLPRESQFAAY